MSDEKRNISDINDQQTAEQQAFSEEIRRRLAEPGSGKPTLEEFKLLVYKDREKRRKKRNTLVACLVAAFIVGFLSFDALVPEVGADKNPKETIQTEDGVIIEDGGYGSSVGEENHIVIDKWEHIEDIRTMFPWIVVPEYIPKGFAFKSFSIESLNTDAHVCEYIFEGRDGVIEIEFLNQNSGEAAIIIGDYTKIVYAQEARLYMQEGKTKKAIIQFDDGKTIYLWANVSDKEYIKIAEGLEH